MAKKAQRLPERFTMQFEPTTIEHLGLKLYSSMPPVIGELVSNAWDAEAHHVWITIPTGTIDEHSEVIIKDDGNGMDPGSMQAAYLFIGRNRRVANQSDSSGKLKGPVTGRKGLGKLSAFGIANQIEVRSVRDGFATIIVLDFEKMKTWPRGTPYEPTIVPAKSGVTSDPKGTTITVRSLRRQKPIECEFIRKALARRFRFIANGFEVEINGVSVQTADRRRKEDCKEAWDVKQLNPSDLVDRPHQWKVTGWIGFLAKSSHTERGVDIFARGKAVELNTMFNLDSTHAQFARAYVIGEIHAEFLDVDEDCISTARDSVNWETEAGQRLEDWGFSCAVG
jgi:hypothetical protein